MVRYGVGAPPGQSLRVPARPPEGARGRQPIQHAPVPEKMIHCGIPRVGLQRATSDFRTSSAFRLFAVLVAHYCRYVGQVNFNQAQAGFRIYGYAVIRPLTLVGL